MDTQLMRDLMYALMRGRHTVATALHDEELSLPEFIALARVADNTVAADDNVCADDLRQTLYVSRPAISQMLKALEASGYIRREINPQNRRKLTVTLTDRGRDSLTRAKARYQRTVDHIVTAFGPDKTRQLIALLAEFAAVVARMGQDEPTP